MPYTTRAKILVQALWIKERERDEPIADKLLPLWQAWVSKLEGNLAKSADPQAAYVNARHLLHSGCD